MSDRYSRQQDLVPEKLLAIKRITVVGVGAVGRQAALQLTSIGAMDLQLIDPDTVELTNIASQGYKEKDIGLDKVVVTGTDCQSINKEIKVEWIPKLFDDNMEVGSIIFCCVDSMKARKQIWKAAEPFCEFFCDSRMAAEALRVLTVCNEDGKEHYPKQLFPDAEAYQASCTAKSTIYCANVAAGMMLAQFAKYLRRLPVDKDISLNLLTNEISVQ